MVNSFIFGGLVFLLKPPLSFRVHWQAIVKRFKLKSRGPVSGKDARDVLIREETRFLLQGNDARFSKQLLARLLEEGCNLPLSVARPLFYRHAVLKLTADLNAAEQSAFARRFPEDHERLSHPRFHGIIRFLHSRLPDAETRMAYAAMDAVAAVIETWRLDDAALTNTPETFEAVAKKTVDRIRDANPAGRLAGLPFTVVIRRLRMALTASLLRHIRDSKEFRSRFGSIPQVLKTIQADPAVFCRVMSFLRDQLPYFSLVASQSFWRTLNNLDTGRGEPSETA